MPRTIELPDEQVSQLEALASREHRGLDEMALIAVSDYLARHQHDWTEWGRRWDADVARIQAHVPPDVTPEEIEADITAAAEELRAERISARDAANAARARSR